MHLKRITQLAATDFAAKPKPQIAYTKPPRQQPANLQRRFTPIGVPTPILPPPVPNMSKKSVDVSMADAPAQDEAPGSSKKSKKRKLVEDSVKTPKSDKKSKKVKTAPEVSKASPVAPPPSSNPPKKTSPVPVPIPGARVPSSSQTAPNIAKAASTPTKDKKSKSNGTVTATPSNKRKLKGKKSDSALRQTPIPPPKIPSMKK
jgi:hypothetical protein